MSSTPRAPLAPDDVQKSLLLGREQSPIFNGITLHVEHSEWVAIIGPADSGNSALLGIIAGLDTPTSGHVFRDGVAVSPMREAQLAGAVEALGVVSLAATLLSQLAFPSTTAGASPSILLILAEATTLICIVVAGSVAWRTTQLRPIEVLRYE